MTEPPIEITPEQFAALVADATDEQLAEGLATNRELILSEIFGRMPEALDPQKAAGLDAVIDWRIADDGGDDRWQLTVAGGKASVERDGQAEATVSLKIGALDFIKLITNRASGPQLFLFGKLKIRGDLMMAARMPGYFRIPGT